MCSQAQVLPLSTLARCACFARKRKVLCHPCWSQLRGASGQTLRFRSRPETKPNPTRMRSLETAATAGVVIVLALAGIIVAEALRAGLPAIASGELPLWRLQARAQVASLASP